MNKIFYCQYCQKIFKTEGKKIEYSHPVYGHCWKRIAPCTTCGAEGDEYSQKISSKKSVDFNSDVNDLRNRGRGGCKPGGGCCG